MVPAAKFKEDDLGEKGEDGEHRDLKRHTKTEHITKTLISDDSSDISFTEVKLAQLYNKSKRMQRDLTKALRLKDYTAKFRGSLKNVMKLDALKE